MLTFSNQEDLYFQLYNIFCFIIFYQFKTMSLRIEDFAQVISESFYLCAIERVQIPCTIYGIIGSLSKIMYIVKPYCFDSKDVPVFSQNENLHLHIFTILFPS